MIHSFFNEAHSTARTKGGRGILVPDRCLFEDETNGIPRSIVIFICCWHLSYVLEYYTVSKEVICEAILGSCFKIRDPLAGFERRFSFKFINCSNILYILFIEVMKGLFSYTVAVLAFCINTISTEGKLSRRKNIWRKYLLLWLNYIYVKIYILKQLITIFKLYCFKSFVNLKNLYR